MENPFKPVEKYSPAVIAITFVFAFTAICFLALIDSRMDDPFLIASFGATAVLIYGAPRSPFSRPKNVFFGHLISAFVGITASMVAQYLGLSPDWMWPVCGLAVATAIVAMMMTGTIHPPGGATALLCVISGFDSYVYIIRPVMMGVVVMMALAYAANRVKEKCRDDQ